MSETHALTTTRPLEATMDQPLTVEHIAHNCAGDRNLHIFQLEDHCRLLATRLAACQQERDTFKNLAGPHTVAWYGENLQASVQEQLRDSRSALDEHMQNYAELHNERDALTVELATKENGLMGLCHQNAALFIEVHDLKASNARLRAALVALTDNVEALARESFATSRESFEPDFQREDPAGHAVWKQAIEALSA